MRKAFIIYDVDGNIIGVVSDKHIKSVEEMVNAVQDLSDSMLDDTYYLWCDVEEVAVFDSLYELVSEKE